MTAELEDKLQKHLFAIAFVCGELACTINTDYAFHHWVAVDAKYVRDKLIKIQDDLIRDLGWDSKK